MGISQKKIFDLIKKTFFDLICARNFMIQSHSFIMSHILSPLGSFTVQFVFSLT